MKTKTFAKKLVLNKKTIADISDGRMGKIQAGWDPRKSTPDTLCRITPDTCETCNTCLGQVTCHFVSYCPYNPC